MKPLKFKYPFRSHQEMILQRFEQERQRTPAGETLRFHVVAPPGAGKTIVGLELALRLHQPALVVCPNTAIQGQWAQKLEMFAGENTAQDMAALVSTNASVPRWLNVLTYQILSIPEDPGDCMIEIAEGIWAEALLESGNLDEVEVRARIQKMKTTNAPMYRKELSKYTKKLRNGKLDELLGASAGVQNPDDLSFESSTHPAVMSTGQGIFGRQLPFEMHQTQATEVQPAEDQRFLGLLHPNTRKLLLGLKEAGIKTVIFDECHHLQTWWAQVMKHLMQWMGIENIIGLTATPPMDENADILENYIGLLGPIDFEIPTPAVVKDGMLAPYQDLLYICRPQEAEWAYLQQCHGNMRRLLIDFAKADSDFCQWMQERLLQRKMADGSQRDWKKLYAARKDYCIAGVKYLRSSAIVIPPDVVVTPVMTGHPTLEEWTMLVEDYALNRLKLSSQVEDIALYNEIRDALYQLGFILTEKGIRSFISPLDRVLAYSRSKLTAVKDILLAEMQSMGDDLRAAVVTDFEFSNALSLKQLDQILDTECGGALAVMKMMVRDPELDKLNPVMVTGKTLLCDDDIAEEYRNRFLSWAQENNLDIALDYQPMEDGSYVTMEGHGKDWNTRSAILFTTALLEDGLTRCIIGTRGLLGEGWDSVALNTLIDLSVATTYASVNQLRGRSIRKDSRFPKKLANNWDVICYAAELEKGANDALRLTKKHGQFYGICADGRISKGTAHLDVRLSLQDRLKTEDTNIINDDMMKRAMQRGPVYDLWRVGEPFENVEQNCLELQTKNSWVPDLSRISQAGSTMKTRTKGLAVQAGFGVAALLAAIVSAGISLPVAAIAGAISAVSLYSGAKGVGKTAAFGRENLLRKRPDYFVKEAALAVFHALLECGILGERVTEKQIVVHGGLEGAVRVYLNSSAEDAAVFSKALDDVFSPLADQRYAVARYMSVLKEGQGNLAFIRNVLSPGEPVLVGYHPVPDVLGLNKDYAAVFQKYWNRYVSQGAMVYLKNEEGQAVLSKYALTDPLGVQKHVVSIWR